MEGWLEGETEVYRFVTKPDLDKFVPKRLQKHFKEGGLQYTDIIKYDPAKISQSPFILDVTSIPPILAERVLPHRPLQSANTRSGQDVGTPLRGSSTVGLVTFPVLLSECNAISRSAS